MRSLFSRAAEERPTEDAIRERRIEVAPRNPYWTELEETALVRRGRVLVHAETDEMFAPHRGVVFQTGSATLVADSLPMCWYLDRDGNPVYLERMPGTWSEVVARRARRGR